MTLRDQAIGKIDSVLRPSGTILKIYSKSNPAAFKQYTGTSHEDLVTNWKTKGNTGQMSACNGFVGWYAGQMGVKITDKDHPKQGWFTMEASLRAIGKGHAWVPAANDKVRPQRGDILHHRKEGTGLHVDVAIGFTPDIKLIRAAAGQITFMNPRKPDQETDLLTIVQGTARYDYQKLIGWLDLERYFEDPPAGGVVPNVNWTIGWWDVRDENQYYYYFDANGNVSYVEKRPLSMFLAPKTPLNTGRYTFPHPHVVKIVWNRLDGEPTVETFEADTLRQTMDGKSTLYGPLKARRL